MNDRIDSNSNQQPHVSGHHFEHRTRCVVNSGIVRVDQCSCGVMHVRIRDAHFKMSPCEFTHFAAAIGMAGEPHLTQISHRAN